MNWPSRKTGFKRFSFGLAQQFFVAAGITIAVSMILLALAISHRIEKSMMQTAAEEGALFTELFLGPSAQDLAASRSLSPESVKKLDDLLAGKLGERIKLIKIWLPDATLVYSTNKEAVGERFPSPHIAAAAAGKVNSEFDYLDAVENATRSSLHVPLVEIYAPLFRKGTKTIIAVGEVYADGRRLADDLASIRLISMGIVGAVSAPMMLILFLMLRRAANLVTDYQATLLKNVVEAKKLAAQNHKLRRAADNARLEAANSNENLLARIGQDLHDGPIQLVSLLMLKLTEPSGKKRAEVGCSGPDNAGTEALTARILSELRDISTGLVLPQLEGLTPNEILRLAVQNHEDATGTKVDRQIGNLPEDLTLPVTICLYRIVQEGLNNAFHHGKAKEQRVEVWADTQSIVVAVSDSGPGLVDNNHANRRSRIGLGIAGLRNRVEALKGTFEVISQRGIGTQIRAKLPVARIEN
ncbi:sensor histidine kinase [Bradyrhizobium sp. AUGA SZCCT0160]|uniref:sensor histidine kinase n=1 Tax=Bradyrhizobium sp. AUGA SZCCT0160 TaxID=2807662 RepID=UPI001BA47948|nr:ATP-binding protein [Bradyrhizobium sp. AUGA SZCCT0160]MBR1187296.1 ATP-binding protein [Bradyrhizobium sp. AUGA SZCCT0160]